MQQAEEKVSKIIHWLKNLASWSDQMLKRWGKKIISFFLLLIPELHDSWEQIAELRSLPSVPLLSDGYRLSTGEGNGTPLQYSGLENTMDGGAWSAAVHGVAKSRTRLSDFTLTSHFHALEKEMATHPSVLAWRIPGTGEPDGLPSMGSHKVGHDRSDLAAAAAQTQHRPNAEAD